MSAGQILVVGGIAFFVAAFLNSRTLLDMAERQPYGWQRTVAVGVTKPLHTLSRWTGLAKPGEAVDHARGRNAGSEDSFDALTTTTVPTASSVASAPTTAPSNGSAAPTAAAGEDDRADDGPRAGDRSPPCARRRPTSHCLSGSAATRWRLRSASRWCERPARRA